MRLFPTIIACLLLAAGPVLAQQPGVQVQKPWARATAQHAPTGVVYLTLVSAADDALTGAFTPAAAAAELHENTMTSAGVMQMRPLAMLALPAGKPVSLSPEHFHLMLTGLKGPLVAGRTLSLHLTFEHAAPLDVTVPITKAGAAGPDDMGGMKM